MWTEMGSVFPPKIDEGKGVGTSVRIPELLLKRVDEIAETQGVSRNAAIAYLLRAGIKVYEKEEAEESKKQ